MYVHHISIFNGIKKKLMFFLIPLYSLYTRRMTFLMRFLTILVKISQIMKGPGSLNKRSRTPRYICIIVLEFSKNFSNMFIVLCVPSSPVSTLQTFGGYTRHQGGRGGRYRGGYNGRGYGYAGRGRGCNMPQRDH